MDRAGTGGREGATDGVFTGHFRSLRLDQNLHWALLGLDPGMVIPHMRIRLQLIFRSTLVDNW